MKTLLTISACALLAASTPVFAQNATNGSTGDLQKNASPNGPAPSHEKQPGASDTESGKAPGVTEGRAGASDETRRRACVGSLSYASKQKRTTDYTDDTDGSPLRKQTEAGPS